jgi:type IV secretion system protein TrbE
MNPVLPVVFSLFGLGFLALLAFRTLELNRAASLKRHRSTDAGFCDLLNYAVVAADGVVVGKNGALIAGWRYAPPDNASATFAERNALAARLSQAVGSLGSGWMFHVDAVRREAAAYSPVSQSHFPDPITTAIDQERRARFEAAGNLYETEFVLTVTYLPPPKVVRRLGEWVYDDDRPKTSDQEEAEGVLERFCRDVDALEDRMSTVFNLERLKARTEVAEDGEPLVFDDLLAHLNRCVTGFDHPIRLPRTPVLLDTLLGGQDLWRDVVPQIGQKHVQVVALDGFPSESYPGILATLAELPLGYRWNTRFMFLDRVEADGHLGKIRKQWEQLVVPLAAKVLNFQTRNLNRDAAAMAEDAHQAKAVVDSQEVVAGYYTGSMVLMHEDRQALEEIARAVQRHIHHRGFTARIESVNNLDAFFGTLPGHGAENVRRPLLHSLNLAHLLPVSGVWTGEETCPCPFYPPNSPPLAHAVTAGSSPFRINLHVHDTAHALIFGPTGSGKSSLMAFLAAQLRRYPRMTAFVFDKGESLFALCKAIGGQHYRVAGDQERLSFCPLGHLESRADRAWAVDWVESVIRLNDQGVTPAQRNEIARSIEGMHRNGHRTLSDFVRTVQDLAIREALEAYTVAGPMGSVFDAERDGLSGLGNFTVFEVSELMELAPKYSLPVLLYLFRRIERSLHGQPAAILIDEAWVALGHEVFQGKIRQWLKEMRKANCAVILATQSLSDAARSGILDVLIESTATKIFLPNPDALQEDAAALYRHFGLNDRQIDIIAGAAPKRDYYLVSGQGCRLFDLKLGRLARAFLCVSSKEDVAQVRKLEAQHGEGWVDEWLAARGLSLSDYLPSEETDDGHHHQPQEILAA